MADSAMAPETTTAEWPPAIDMTKPLPEALLAGRQQSNWGSDHATDAETGGPSGFGLGSPDSSLNEDKNVSVIPCGRHALGDDDVQRGLLKGRILEPIAIGRGEIDSNIQSQNSLKTRWKKRNGKAVRFHDGLTTVPQDPLITSYTAAPGSQPTFQAAGNSSTGQDGQRVAQPYPVERIDSHLLNFTYTAQTPGSFKVDGINGPGGSRLTLRRPAREKTRPFNAPFTLARYLEEVRQLYTPLSRTPDGPLRDIATAVFRTGPEGPVVLQHISTAHMATPAIAATHADYTTALFNSLPQDESLTVIRLFKKLFVYDGRDTSSGFGLQMITPYLDRPDVFTYAQHDPELWFRPAFEREVRALLGEDAGNPIHCKVQVDRFKGEWLEYRADMTAKQFLEDFVWKIDDPFINIYPFNWRPQRSFEEAEEERAAAGPKVFKDYSPILQPTFFVPAATAVGSTGTVINLERYFNSILDAANTTIREVQESRTVSEQIRRNDLVTITERFLTMGEGINTNLNDLRRQVFEEFQKPWNEQRERLGAIIQSQATLQTTLEKVVADQLDTQRDIKALQAAVAPPSDPRPTRNLAGSSRCPWQGCAHDIALNPPATYQLRLEQHHATHVTVQDSPAPAETGQDSRQSRQTKRKSRAPSEPQPKAKAASKWICPTCGKNTHRGAGNRKAHWANCGVTEDQLISASDALAIDPAWTATDGYSTKRKRPDEEETEDNGEGPSKKQKVIADSQADVTDDQLTD